MLLWTTRGQCGICPPDQLPKCTCVSVILQKQQMLKVGLGGHSDYNTTQLLLSSWTPCEQKSMQAPCSTKGGLISEFFHFCSNLRKKGAKSLSWTLSTLRKNAQECDLALFLDLIQSEKNPEIMPPLGFDPTSFNSFCIENCSDQLREKTVLVIEKNFWKFDASGQEFAILRPSEQFIRAVF